MVGFKSRVEKRKQEELEEARKAGLEPAEVDEDGKEINPHIPQYMVQAPWYINPAGPSLKHQKNWKSDPNYTKSWYDRGAKTYQANKYRKGACENCGAMTHNAKSCMERPRQKGAKFTNKNIAPDEKIEVEKRVRTTGGGSTGTVRNLRIREDVAKYLLNLDPNSAYYDPKTRSMREDPLPDADPNEKFYGGDNQCRVSGQALEFKQLNVHAWEAFKKGEDVHMQAAPSQAELLFRNFKVSKEKLKSKTKDLIMEKYGNVASEEEMPKELLLGQSERQVEYDRAGRVIKGLMEILIPKSKYEEDVFLNNHTSVWGSWWNIDAHQWGYQCCKQLIRNSYCTGLAGIEASEAAIDLMKANIARKATSEESPAPAQGKQLAIWGTDVPDDLVLDEKLLSMALKKEDERRREEKDERKRKFNVSWNDEVTAEDMEAYRVRKIHHDGPMKDFIS
ncbi:Pre-mRNA splicing Prp18-interacting factor [Corchorus capsularis]|uniref:Pre-mRNA-splicing factor SLU7 n=1 Tax=Corchorus capsularis TaxID=210143 RepID=A0A1R3GEU6_COCAP|nr:Pre-mRNA splicing Prp18-interacting factor [Corchorus capsularis]